MRMILAVIYAGLFVILMIQLFEIWLVLKITHDIDRELKDLEALTEMKDTSLYDRITSLQWEIKTIMEDREHEQPDGSGDTGEITES